MALTENHLPLKLEGKTKDGSLWVVNVDHSPFIIGRKEGSSLFLSSDTVSRKHAEIVAGQNNDWLIRDCGSTNGTYLNGKKLTGNYPLTLGDTIRFGDLLFTVVDWVEEFDSTHLVNPYTECIEELLDKQMVNPYFQPLVLLSNGELIGYEVLGRIDFMGLPNNPRQLFEISATIDRQIELSELFRNKAIEHAASLGVKELILFNTLPEEMRIDLLRPSLCALRQSFPDLKLGMELHENAITDVTFMQQLRKLLDELSIELVYDDFGAGQSRLIELLDFKPSILKFDIALIRNIQHRSEASRSMVATLVKMANDVGIRTLAEGIESIEEADTCRAIGFELGQGFYLGRPAPLT